MRVFMFTCTHLYASIYVCMTCTLSTALNISHSFHNKVLFRIFFKSIDPVYNLSVLLPPAQLFAPRFAGPPGGIPPTLGGRVLARPSPPKKPGGGGVLLRDPPQPASRKTLGGCYSSPVIGQTPVIWSLSLGCGYIYTLESMTWFLLVPPFLPYHRPHFFGGGGWVPPS